MTTPFIGAAKVETMLTDFNRLRTAVRNYDPEETEKAFEKCERWIDCINPTASKPTPQQAAQTLLDAERVNLMSTTGAAMPPPSDLNETGTWPIILTALEFIRDNGLNYGGRAN